MTYYAAVSTVNDDEFSVVVGQVIALEFISDETFISPETGEYDQEMKNQFFENCHNSIISFAAAKQFNPKYIVVEDPNDVEVIKPNPKNPNDII